MKGPSKPEHVREIYDNGGETLDRYTVLTTWPENPTGCYMALGLSDNPTDPQGFSQWTAAMPGRHLGKRVPWAEIPEHIRVHVVARMAE